MRWPLLSRCAASQAIRGEALCAGADQGRSCFRGGGAQALVLGLALREREP